VLREAGGGPGALRLETVEDPVPGAGEVIVRVRAAALNHRDLFITRGQYDGLDVAPAPGSIAAPSPSCWATTAWARWPRSGPVSKACRPATALSSTPRSIGETIRAPRGRGFASSVFPITEPLRSSSKSPLPTFPAAGASVRPERGRARPRRANRVSRGRDAGPGAAG
jgi:hypothetical protein